MDNRTADQLLREMAEEALKVQNARAAAQNARGKQVLEEEPANHKRKPDDHPAQGESSKKAKPAHDACYQTDVGPSMGESPEVMPLIRPLHPSANVAQDFSKFSKMALAEGLPSGKTGLKEAAA